MTKQKRKASALQIVAAQNNGAKSQGPVTPQGLARSAKNAIRHNHCSKALVLATEDKAAFAEHQKNYFDQFEPEGEIEFELVTDMVAAKWRQRRLWAVETALYDVQMHKQMNMIDHTFKSVDQITRCAIAFQALADESKALALVLRYETSMRRMHEKCLETLMDLQAIRKSAAAEPAGTTHPPSDLEAATAPGSQPVGNSSRIIPSTPIQKLPNEPGALEISPENTRLETGEVEFPKLSEAA